MKRKDKVILAGAIALSLALVGCASGAKREAPPPAPAPAPVVQAPAPEPQTYVFVEEDLGFAFDSAELTPSETSGLDQVANELRDQPDVAYEVAGYTDSIGSEDYNQRLSERRAIAVHDYLVQQDVPSGQLTVRGYGEENPIASNDTAEGRAQNRRVEIRPVETRW